MAYCTDSICGVAGRFVCGSSESFGRLNETDRKLQVMSVKSVGFEVLSAMNFKCLTKIN
jgi:hypothetical protein